MNHWTLIRIGIVGFAGISSALTPNDASAVAALGWEIVAVAFLFFPVVVTVGLCILLPFRKAKLKWEKPGWNQNPFSLTHPEQFFHLVGYVMLASGIGLLVAELWSPDGGLVYALAVAGFGAGLLAGLGILGFIAGRQAKPEVHEQI